nr:PREDICTED: UDP-glucuronic acid decarboxylase 2-like [Musa acuminata subsp. malaccensis]
MASELIYRGHDAAHTPTSGGAGYTPKPEKRLLWFSRPLRYLIREQRLAFLLVGMALATLFFALAPSSSPSSYSSAAAAELALRSAMELARFGEHHRHRAAFEAATSRGFVGGKVPLGIKRKGLRIVVTGGAGFVGSHLVDRLIARGDSVIVVDNFFTGRKENVMHHFGNPNFELIRHDVVEPLLLEVDQIYHLACPASPVHYKFNPVKTIKTNVVGTLNMLGLAKRVGARFLLTSTSEVYGDPLQHPQVETYWGNVNPIGWVATWNLQVDPFHKECLMEWNGYLSCTWQALLNKLPTIDNMKRRGDSPAI